MRLSVGRKKIRIGDVLVAAGAITEEQLQEGLAKQKETGRKLGNALVDLGFISNDMLITVLTTQLGIDYIELKGAKIEDKVIHMVPESMVTKYQAIPIEVDPDNPNILKVAMADPMDIMAMDDIGLVTNLQVEPMLASEEGIKNAIDKYYGSAQAMEAAEAYRQEQQSVLGGDDEDNSNDEVDNSPIVLLVKQIIEGGVRQRASDIHIEALENSVRVRYRIDGALKQVMSYDLSILAGITARIKIIGGMDIAEKRKPQDGRITIMVDRREFDVRVSILPTVFGEKTVMRLTSKDGLTKPKSALGFDAEQEKVFDNILSNPHGIILVTGPTGSGKSTTLYTSLSELNTEDVNIITVEDPVEANINGINQVQVNNKADMTFAAALRSILRQDPDIIMIGEIRDGETAGIAVQAAITGHLVVSTLHTNSAAQRAAADVAERAELRQPRHDGGQDISRPLPEQQIQRLLLHAAARQPRPPVREKSQHMKAHRPPDAGKNGKVPRLPAGDAARALRALDHAFAAAERHMQRMTFVTQHGPRLQDPALLHGEQQLLSGIALRLRMQPFRKHMIHKIPPIPAPIYAGRGRKGDTPWTYRSTISSS